MKWKALVRDGVGRRGRKMIVGIVGVRDGGRSFRKRCCELFIGYNDCFKVNV